MKLLSAIVAPIVLALASASAYSADFSGQGIGAVSCANYNSFKPQKNRTFVMYSVAWAQGYLSAMAVEANRKVAPPMRNTDPEAIEARLDKYCSEHPDHLISYAVVDLWVELSKPL